MMAYPDQKTEHFTKMIRVHMEEPAWRALSVYAQALYPWLKLEWRGPKANNNGKIRFTCRQAAEATGMNHKTAAKAFQDLQAKGWLVITAPARLGVGGMASAPSWELTEIALPHTKPSRPRSLYRDWKPGMDFPVHKATPQNPTGKNGASSVVQMRVIK